MNISSDPINDTLSKCEYTSITSPLWREWLSFSFLKGIYDVLRTIYLLFIAPWDKSFSVVSTNGSVAISTVFSVTFLALNTNTSNPTVDGVPLLPGVSITFSSPFASLNSAAFSYTAANDAQLYILEVKPS